MTTTEHDTNATDHEASCLMCAVRALTEGDPAVTWFPSEPGATIAGVVLKMGTSADNLLGQVPFVDLWTGGTGRVRIKLYAHSLRHSLDGVAPKIGDRLQVWFDGEETSTTGQYAGRQYKRFSANVQRGH